MAGPRLCRDMTTDALLVTRSNAPDGGFWGLGFLERLRREPLRFSADLARDHGDVVDFRIGPQRVFQLTHPIHNHAVLTTKAKSFRKPRRLVKVLGQWNGNGLVVNDGASWMRQRRMIMPSFKPSALSSYVAIAVAHTEALLERWRNQTEVDAAADLARLSLGVVAESLFGAASVDVADELTEAIAILNEEGIRELSSPVVLPMWFPSPRKRRMRSAVAVLHDVVERMIEARRHDRRDDLLSALMDAVDADDGEGMPERQVRDEAVNLLLGGNETTATALTWTLHAISQHPEVQTRLGEESLEQLGGRAPEAADVPNLRYAGWCLSEAMRLYPPAYVLPREAAEDVELVGVTIPRGAAVNLVPYVTQRDPRWFADPNAYRPERFARQDLFTEGSYLPFGLGPRACIGRRFAMMEAAVVIAMIHRELRLEPTTTGLDSVPMVAEISLHPAGALTLRPRPAT